MPQLQNVVSTVNLGCKLDLAAIAQSARNAEYNPKRFAACIVRIREPKTTALMFNSGKMVIAGAKSEEASRLAARKVPGSVAAPFSWRTGPRPDATSGSEPPPTALEGRDVVASCAVQSLKRRAMRSTPRF